jgi:hypothetical protein
MSIETILVVGIPEGRRIRNEKMAVWANVVIRGPASFSVISHFTANA